MERDPIINYSFIYSKGMGTFSFSLCAGGQEPRACLHQPHKLHVNAVEAAETDGPTAERRRTAVQRAEQEMTDGADAEVTV